MLRSASIAARWSILMLAIVHVTAAADKPLRPLPLFPSEIVWSIDLGVPAAPPSYDELRAYVPLRTGHVVALSLENGEVAWKVELNTLFAPAVGGDLVYIAADETIEALESVDGQPRWRVPVPEKLSAPPFWRGGWLLAASEAKRLLALRASDGTVVWQRDLPSALRRVPAISGDRVYLPLEDGRVTALDLGTGQPLWERMLGGPASEILAVDDRIYVGSMDNFFYCLMAKDGAVKWRWRTGADVVGPPAIDDSNVYFTALDNALRAVDRINGVQRWRQSLKTRPLAGPSLIDGLLLVSHLTPEVHSFYLRDGVIAGTYTAPSELAAPVHIIPRALPLEPRVVLLTGEGRLVAIERVLDPPLKPLESLPGKVLTVEPSPIAPEDELK